MADKNWEVEIEKINGEVKLINQKLDILENNHLAHIQKQIDKLGYVLWTVGFGVFMQLIFVVRNIIF